MKEEHDIHGFTKDDVVTVNKDTPRSAMHPNDFIAKKGERFVVIGHSGNELHPISIGRENDRAYRFAVSANEITQLPPARQEGETPRTDKILLVLNEGRVYKDEGPLVTFVRTLECELSAKQAELEEHQRRFDNFWNNSIRAKQMWREKTGKELEWPDQTDLLVWLVTELESLKAAQEGLSKALSDFRTHYQTEYEKELRACDTWIKWCEDNNDSHGMNFHQGKQSSHISLDITMRSLLKSLEVLTLQTPPVERSENKG